MSTAYFDFDDTLFPGDSILYWKRYYFQQRPTRRWFQIFSLFGIFLYLLRIIDSNFLKRIFLMPLCYENETLVSSLAKQFVEKELKPRLINEVISELAYHSSRKKRIVIISASPYFYLQYLRDICPNLTIVGTQINFPKSGFFRLPQFSSKLGNMKGENKVTYILESNDEPKSGKGCYAYSDSHWDLPLLRFCEFPIAVCPNIKLQKEAEAFKWRVIGLKHFTEKITHLLKKLVLIVLH